MTTTSATSTTTTTATTFTWSSGVGDMDWDALVEVSVAAKNVRADTIETEISENEVKLAAYEEMQSLLTTLSDAAYALSAPSGTSNSSYDVFNSRAAYTSATGDTDADSAVFITVEDGTDTGSFDLTIEQLATAHKVASAEASDNTAALGYDGSFTVQLGDGDSAEISLDSDMTLDDIAEAINAQSYLTNVRASVVKVSDDSYQLVIYGTETGQDLTLTAASGDDVLTGIGVLDGSGGIADELQAAQNAIITYDGITVTRTSNEIDDLIDGVTLNLYEATGEDTITVEVSQNVDEIKDAIIALAEAYNAYREWALTQQETSSAGGASSGAALFGDSTLRSVNSQIASALGTFIDSESMALLGLSYDSSNMLVLDEDVLNEALLNDLDAVTSLLSFQMEASSADLSLLSHSNNGNLDFTLDITSDGEGNLSVSVDGDSSLFTVSGTRIKGAEGSIYEGLTFVYLGDGDESIDVSVTSGIAEALYASADAAANTLDGNLQTIIDNLGDENSTLQTKADDIRSRSETYREFLTEKYAKYQAAIEEAETQLAYLEALLEESSN
ncbi:MAG: flagellar hook protein [Hyphomicrobiales bacterium]|nr:MAG: flagellar hook protein [Hyphomicrobiales bacterium]